MSALDDILQAAERITEVGGPGISLNAGLVMEAAAEIAELRKDKARLDRLDDNLKMRTEWDFRVAPAGNIGATTVICLGREPRQVRKQIDAIREDV